MAWYDEAVFYHIYPLGLCGAPKHNDYGEVQHNLKKLIPWIAHIKNIGCNAIYIGPLFESVGHGYETTDYKKLDTRLGDNNDLKEFVKECHKEGVKVIFDGVFNHTGRDFFAFQDIKHNREHSRYKDWYCNVNFWGNNEFNDGFSYQNWGGYDLLVKLNQRNPEVQDYIRDVIRFWVSEFDVDGIRLDAADVLDFDFMKMLRSTANEVKPDFWLMGEVIHGDYTRWVNEGTLHSVTNYHLHKALFSGHNDHNYFEIAHTVKRLYGMGGNRPEGLKLYNFVDNHDVERIYTKLANKANFVPVHILMYTLPGIPSIYYGSEFGIEGRKERFSDDSLRPALNLGDFAGADHSNQCTALIKALGSVRQSVPALSYGDYNEVMLSTRQYVYTRSFNGCTVIIAVNNDDNDADICANRIPDGEYKGALTGEIVTVSDGTFRTHIYANSGEIFVPSGYTQSSSAYDLKVAAEAARKERLAKEQAARIAKEKAEAERKEREQRVEAEKQKNGSSSAKVEGTVIGSAADKYGLDAKYNSIDPAVIASRSDYDCMTIEELQVAILEKMAKNGPVNAQMIKTVMDNIYPNSLQNWVRSFR